MEDLLMHSDRDLPPGRLMAALDLTRSLAALMHLTELVHRDPDWAPQSVQLIHKHSVCSALSSQGLYKGARERKLTW